MTKTDTIDFGDEQIHLIGPMVALQRVLAAARRLTRRPERMALIIGDQGMGKTLGARWFASQHDDAVYIQIPPASVLRPGRLLHLVERALDMPVGGRTTLYDAMLGIIDELRRDPRLLIFDNANRLRRYDYIDMLRYIHDEAAARMAFISIPALEHVFRQHAEFAGRLQIYHQLKPPTKDEVRAILPDFSTEAVDAIYEFSGGRMREVMVLAEHFRMDEVPVKERTPDRVRRVARAFTLRAA